MLKILLYTTLLISFSAAFAADSAPGDTYTPDAGANAVPGADKVDELITNPNLRAMSGSKSRWSLSNSVTYDGGTVSSPFAEGRPNIANASATSTDTDINDTISVKFSIDPVNSILFGIGVRKMAPFTGSGPTAKFYNEGGKDVDVFDPTITYQYIYKLFGIQAVAQVGMTQYTREDIHSVNYNNLNQNAGFDQENIYEIGKLSIGGSFGFGGNTPTSYLSKYDYSRFQFWFDPYVEYKLSDTFNLRTVANAWSYEIWLAEGTQRDAYTQSVGVGCSVTRDIFLYPNIQFLPGQISKDLTNVGLTATINLF